MALFRTKMCTEEPSFLLFRFGPSEVSDLGMFFVHHQLSFFSESITLKHRSHTMHFRRCTNLETMPIVTVVDFMGEVQKEITVEKGTKLLKALIDHGPD